jgi:hypothetical protein
MMCSVLSIRLRSACAIVSYDARSSLMIHAWQLRNASTGDAGEDGTAQPRHDQ